MFPISTIKKQTEEYGVPWWKLPDVLLIFMALINISSMVLLYWWLSTHWQDTQFAVVVAAVDSAVVMIIGNIVVETSKRIVSVNKLRKEFIDIMSHQMRTPTSIIRWYIELLLKDGETVMTDKQVGYIHCIADANSKLISLVNDLLNLINVEHNRTQLNIEKVDLIEIVEQTVKSQTLFAKSRNITVTMKKGRHKKALVMSDAIKLKMAVENLINNAIKYSYPHGNVDISIKEEKDGWVCQIKDNGMGIRAEEQRYLFEKFYRTNDKRKLDIQGTGLGLFISRALIRKMGGSIWFTSTENKGTNFFFKLPGARA